jgi:predicted short-subunit dehydrogenase-like oxidoreductase (DUF2520 family)
VTAVAIVGSGRVGTAIAVLLRRAGYAIVGVTGRAATPARVATHLPGVPIVAPSEAVGTADLVVVAVPDDAVVGVVEGFAGSCRPGTWVLHSSGALGLSALDAAIANGARRLAVHPLQTFPDVERAIEELPGCAAAVTADDEEGYALGERLALDLGARPFRLPDGARPLYHAAAVLASNDVVALSALAGRAFGLAGGPDPDGAMLPLQRATVANVGRLGPEAALTGPAVRGDAGTVARNLEALAVALPEAVAPYVVLARAALDLAVGAGRLDAQGRTAVEEVLDRWS